MSFPAFFRQQESSATTVSATSGHHGEQCTLDLFPPCSFETLCSRLHVRNLSITFNRRLKKSWYVKIDRLSHHRELSLPPLFEHAPEPVKQSLIEWATQPALRAARQSAPAREKRRHLERVLRTYLDEHASHAGGKREAPGQKWPTKGVRYDLREVFDTVNRTCFNSTLSSYVRWGSPASKTSYEVTRKDATEKPWHCITIAGIYNHPDVPRFAIEAIMYHEMLHIHIPPKTSNNRRVIHGSDFRTMEKQFSYYHEWRSWEKEHVPGILRQLLRKNRRTSFFTKKH